MDMDNLALKRIAVQLGHRFEAMARAVKITPAKTTATPKEQRADGVITAQETANVLRIKGVISLKFRAAMDARPSDSVSKLYAYSTAMRDADVLMGGGAVTARARLDRPLTDARIETIADRFIVRGFEKEARANARSHLKALKGPQAVRQPG